MTNVEWSIDHDKNELLATLSAIINRHKAIFCTLWIFTTIETWKPDRSTLAKINSHHRVLLLTFSYPFGHVSVLLPVPLIQSDLCPFPFPVAIWSLVGSHEHRLQVVPHLSSGIVERARVKITPREKSDTPFSRGVIFTRASSAIPEEKWATTRILPWTSRSLQPLFYQSWSRTIFSHFLSILNIAPLE